MSSGTLTQEVTGLHELQKDRKKKKDEQNEKQSVITRLLSVVQAKLNSA